MHNIFEPSYFFEFYPSLTIKYLKTDLKRVSADIKKSFDNTIWFVWNEVKTVHHTFWVKIKAKTKQEDATLMGKKLINTTLKNNFFTKF